jgi:FtsP/CotA-like multicopper oxidase with cupredoxin domain
MLTDEQEWMAFRIPASAPTAASRSQCMPQYVRIFRELGAVPSMASVPYGPFSKAPAALPRPGPTLRARVGDLIQLTFINQINPNNFGNSIDRGEVNLTGGIGGGCDEVAGLYPGKDVFPDCFHGSSTGNIHFHGTHTNPNTTADNVFIEIRPSLRVNGQPVVTPESVAASFNTFFGQCEEKLSTNVLREWPKTWSDLPSAWTSQQETLLKQYDAEMEKAFPPPARVKKLWPVDDAQQKMGAWPQYYIGAYPYCFRLPEYKSTVWPPPAPMDHDMGAGKAEDSEDNRTLIMGQSPGTHWYHAHKHGSTAINVANGMTGAFIIEGQYDDDLNAFYGQNWTRTQPVLVINQLGASPNLMRGGGQRIDKGPDFSVNGQYRPVITMRPGEVQMWRIVNTSGRAGTYFVGPPKGFQWRQLAQDGVQFVDANYQSHLNRPFLLAAGNRADFLVKAPGKCVNPGDCDVVVQNEVDPSDLTTAAKLPLFSVKIAGDPVDPMANASKFIPTAPTFPAFLTDITNAEISGTKKIMFASNSGSRNTNNTIDGKQFDGEVGAVVLLNRVEEWKVMNATTAISHPFHIHINPFQISEIFDPNETFTPPNSNTPVNRYVFQGGIQLLPGQCYLNPQGDPDDWKPCGPPAPFKNGIWWDVFPIPSARTVSITTVTGEKINVNVPGYFKMRSRFVDYAGFYVIHCHILAHEDRGMMTIVEVAPARTPYSHH